jgi:hypothetical protein
LSSILIAFMILTTTSSFSAYASSDAYDSGYDHGCDDARISDPDDRYINQPGKGPSFHTDRFMDGYNDGFNSCNYPSRNGDGFGSAGSGNLKVILNLETHHCDLNFRISIGGDRVGQMQSCTSSETFTANVDTYERVSVCAYGTDNDLSGCTDIVNGPEKEPERVNVYVD